MNIALIGFGGGGTRIADHFKRVERLDRQHITGDDIYTFDTAASHEHTDRIPDDQQILLSKKELKARGTAKRVEKGASYTKSELSKIRYTLTDLTNKDLDAVLIVHTLGGGTGGGGAPILIDELTDYLNAPIYAASVLPSHDDYDLMKLNAARSIQSTTKYAHNTILFDNEQLDATWPETGDDSHPDIHKNDDYYRANNEIAASLHYLFSADESVSTDFESTTITTEHIIDALSVGGISTVSKATDVIPRSARPGIINRIWELGAFLKRWHNRQVAHSGRPPELDVPDEALEPTTNRQTTPTTDTGDPFTRQAQSEGTPTPEDDREANIHPEPSPNSSDTSANFQPNGEASNADESHPNSSIKQETELIHPADLIPSVLSPENAMVSHNPLDAHRHLFILSGLPKILTSDGPRQVNEWVSDAIINGEIETGNFAKRTKHATAYKLSAGIGIPDRVQELQQEASEIVARFQEEEANEQVNDPQEFNPFHNKETDIPEVL